MKQLQALKKSMKESAWQGRSGTMETSGATMITNGASITSVSTEPFPPSLRHKKKCTELPPLNTNNVMERVHSAPQVS